MDCTIRFGRKFWTMYILVDTQLEVLNELQAPLFRLFNSARCVSYRTLRFSLSFACWFRSNPFWQKDTENTIKMAKYTANTTLPVMKSFATVYMCNMLSKYIINTPQMLDTTWNQALNRYDNISISVSNDSLTLNSQASLASNSIKCQVCHHNIRRYLRLYVS